MNEQKSKAVIEKTNEEIMMLEAEVRRRISNLRKLQEELNYQLWENE